MDKEEKIKKIIEEIIVDFDYTFNIGKENGKEEFYDHFTPQEAKQFIISSIEEKIQNYF